VKLIDGCQSRAHRRVLRLGLRFEYVKGTVALNPGNVFPSAVEGCDLLAACGVNPKTVVVLSRHVAAREHCNRFARVFYFYPIPCGVVRCTVARPNVRRAVVKTKSHFFTS